MTGTRQLRAAIAGLVGLAATEEQRLLAITPAAEEGTPGCWAALPVVAHNTEFRGQQVQRLRAIRRGAAPPEFGEADHQSAEIYAELAGRPGAAVAQDGWHVAGELLVELQSVSNADLTDPTRNPWLRGRQLWLQIVVRGFWHPTGHLSEYYLNHGQPERAIALARHAVATASYLGAPAPVRGMACYNLACAQAGSGLLDEAAATVRDAVALNPDVRANAARDRDLAAVRDSGRLAEVIGG
jgi:hypothetical protein